MPQYGLLHIMQYMEYESAQENLVPLHSPRLYWAVKKKNENAATDNEQQVLTVLYIRDVIVTAIIAMMAW